MKVLLLVVLCFLSYSSAIQFVSNISFNANNEGWSFRDTDLLTIPGVGIQQVYYTSNELDGNKHSFNVSGIFGAGIFLYSQVPYTFVAAYDATSGWHGGNGGSWQSASVSAALGYMASAYVKILERDSNGDIVFSQSLRYGAFSSSLMKWSTDYRQDGDILQSSSVIGKPNNGESWYINITFVASSQVGVIDLANAVVGPSSFEQLVQINNWPYRNQDNYLEVVIMTVSGDASSSSSASFGALVSSGSGSSQVYFTAAAQAIINGNSQKVTVTATASTSTDISDLGDNAFLLAQVATRYTNPTYQTISIAFPANAASITYDPAIGSGQPLPTDSHSSLSTSLTYSLSLLVLVTLLSIIF